ncbi:MAG: thiaminase II [Dehalococcoidia bacterium]
MENRTVSKVERFQDHLRKLVDPIWEAQHNHPFIRGVGDGSLDIELLKHWVRQDYVYLIDYARIMSTASARAPDLDTMAWFARLTKGVFKEMELHRSYAKDFGISEAELEAERKAPTCQGYTDFLLRTATVDPFEVLVGALLPCFWGYYELGTRLEDQGLPENELYARWIKQYSDPDYGREVDRCRNLIDRLAAEASAELRGQMEQAFLLSSRYEYLFWEMCYTRETWPV